MLIIGGSITKGLIPNILGLYYRIVDFFKPTS